MGAGPRNGDSFQNTRSGKSRRTSSLEPLAMLHAETVAEWRAQPDLPPSRIQNRSKRDEDQRARLVRKSRGEPMARTPWVPGAKSTTVPGRCCWARTRIVAYLALQPTQTATSEMSKQRRRYHPTQARLQRSGPGVLPRLWTWIS